MRILVDDEVSRDTLAGILRKSRYKVLTAATGREALEILARGDCRMVISDWVMPEVNGPTLCRAIREGEFSSYIYIILLTVRNSPENVIEGLSAGADDFITKPVHPGELRVRIRAGERILALEPRDLVIFALAKLAESRDPEMGGHLERVRRDAKVLAERLAESPAYRGVIDGEFVRLLFQTAPLHDIGKAAIGDDVLLKRGRLTAQEYELMKTHTTKGAHTLEAALKQHPEAAFLKMARDIALTRHERYDGRGYPAGLAGDDIPLAGRIVALAYVYDAVTSARVYKEPFDHATAWQLIVNERGKQFDPDVVDAFIVTEDDFMDIHDHFTDHALQPA